MILLTAILLQTWHPPKCDDRAPGGEARCARAEFAKAEQMMTREFDRALYRVQHCKPVNSTRCAYRPRALAVLRAEQRSWKAWRDSHCDVVAFGVVGTSAESLVRDDCKTQLTVERIQTIKKIGLAE